MTQFDSMSCSLGSRLGKDQKLALVSLILQVPPEEVNGEIDPLLSGKLCVFCWDALHMASLCQLGGGPNTTVISEHLAGYLTGVGSSRTKDLLQELRTCPTTAYIGGGSQELSLHLAHAEYFTDDPDAAAYTLHTLHTLDTTGHVITLDMALEEGLKQHPLAALASTAFFNHIIARARVFAAQQLYQGAILSQPVARFTSFSLMFPSEEQRREGKPPLSYEELMELLKEEKLSYPTNVQPFHLDSIDEKRGEDAAFILVNMSSVPLQGPLVAWVDTGDKAVQDFVGSSRP